MLNILEFGARDDRQFNSQAAIQAAIDACAQSGGGTVYFPAGNYLSGTLRLRSHVILHLDAGATLWASTARSDYPSPDDYEKGGRWVVGALLVAEDEEHVGIEGEGVIHGQGTADYGARWGVAETLPFRRGIALFHRCRQVTLRGVTILFGDAWTIHLQRCENVFIDGVTILNNPHRLNSDGIDPNSCRNVHISNCHIIAGDDCIVCKTTEPYPCENIVVTNCTLETPCMAIKIGTESFGDFRHLIGIYVKDGATVEQVTFSDISFAVSRDDTTPLDIFPIFMDIEKRAVDSRIGSIRDIAFRDIHILTSGGILIQGMPASPIENLTIQNLTCRIEKPIDYSHRAKSRGGRRAGPGDERDTLYARQPAYVTLAHVKGLVLDNIAVLMSEEDWAKYERAAVCGCELEDGVLRNIRRQPAGEEGQIPAVLLENCRGMKQ
jgi:polygalacturonase